MKERIKYYAFILLISIIVCIPLFFEDFNIYADDGIQHICRLMGTCQSIDEGQVFPVIMSKFCNNFGYSWNLFYSPITAYVPLLFKILTSSYIVMLKLFMLVVTFLTGVTMYEFLRKVTKNVYAGLIGAVIYILAPYRLTDMYMRIAIAELTSFIFLPMIFNGLYNIFDEEYKGKKGEMLLVIGASGIILTHTVISMYTAIFCAIYVLIHIKRLKDKKVLKKLLLSLLLILCITSFYTFPMLEHKLNTQYEVFRDERMVREDALLYYKSDIIDLFYTKQGAFIVEIGFVTVVGFILSIFAANKIDKKYTKLYIFSILAGIISIIMTLKWFPFEKLPSILKMLQFSFRMLEFSSFFLSILVAINYSVVIKNFKMKDVLIISLIALLSIVPLKKNIYYKENLDESILWSAVRVSENTGRVHAGCATFEYLPSKAFDNLDYIKTREDRIYILSGNAEILNEEKKGTKMTVEILDITKDTVLELPYIYYLGYDVKLDYNGNIKDIEYTESDNGFIKIEMNEDIKKGKILVNYTGTKPMKISTAISIMSFTFLVIYYCCITRKSEVNLEK